MKMLRLHMLFLLPALLWALWPSSAPAVEDEPWSLAFVMENGGYMAQEWLGETRGKAALRALERELRTLPVRSTAALWATGEGGAVAVVPPTAAMGLKAVRVLPPPPSGEAGLGLALEKAAAWVASRGKGAVVLVCSAREGAIDPQTAAGLPLGGGDKPFCHVLALGPAPGRGVEPPTGLADLALLGGGGLSVVDRPNQTPLALHLATQEALSGASLLVSTHDRENRPLDIAFGLKRTDRLAVLRGKSNRPVQLSRGSYQMEWPKGVDLGPGEPPKMARIVDDGVTRLWAGGRGRLEIEARGAGGEALDWRVLATRLADGRLAIPWSHVPVAGDVPAGLYQVRSLHPALAWTLEVRPGATCKLVAGPPGEVLARLAGPGGDLRVPYKAEPVQGAGRPKTGYTGTPLQLPTGTHRLEVEVAPPLVKEVEVAPAGRTELDLPMVGGLRVELPLSAPTQRFEVLDREGNLLARGATNLDIYLQPGSYRVRTRDGLAERGVTIQPGRLTTLSP